MSYRLRKLVFWLLLLALPLQGFAAVTGAACTCPHAQMVMGMPDHGTAGAAPGAHAAGQDDDSPCHTPPAMDDRHCTVHADDGTAGKSESSSGTSSCDVCSGCCIVHVALPVTTIVPHDPEAPRAAVTLLPDLFKDYVAPTPKRPPRSISA